MRFVILTLFLFKTWPVFSQKENYCHPNAVDKMADSIIGQLDKDELSDVLKSEDFWNSNRYAYLNYEDIEPAIIYAKKVGFNLHEGYAAEATNEYIFYRVRKADVCFNTIVEKYITEINQFSTNDTIDGEYIPKNIDECITQLDKTWNDNLKQKFKNNAIEGVTEYDIGRTLRNRWGLWGHSRLARYFDTFGVSNPENASFIILACYKKYLTGEPLQFDEEIENYKKRQRMRREPLLQEYPKYVRNVRHQGSMGLYNKNGSDTLGSIHFYTDKTKTLYWVYNYKYGWKKLTPREYEESKNNKDIIKWLSNTYNAGKN